MLTRYQRPVIISFPHWLFSTFLQILTHPGNNIRKCFFFLALAVKKVLTAPKFLNLRNFETETCQESTKYSHQIFKRYINVDIAFLPHLVSFHSYRGLKKERSITFWLLVQIPPRIHPKSRTSPIHKKISQNFKLIFVRIFLNWGFWELPERWSIISWLRGWKYLINISFHSRTWDYPRAEPHRFTIHYQISGIQWKLKRC